MRFSLPKITPGQALRQGGERKRHQYTRAWRKVNLIVKPVTRFVWHSYFVDQLFPFINRQRKATLDGEQLIAGRLCVPEQSDMIMNSNSITFVRLTDCGRLEIIPFNLRTSVMITSSIAVMTTLKVGGNESKRFAIQNRDDGHTH